MDASSTAPVRIPIDAPASKTPTPLSPRSSRDRRPRRKLLVAITIAYLAFVGIFTLGPQPFTRHNRGFADFLVDAVHRFTALQSFRYSDLEFLANIGMFVPIGILFVLLFGRRRWWLAIVVGVALTLIIEGTQLFLPTRVSDVRDLIANSSGAAIGALISLIGMALTARSRH
jgi:glycopeptide antibiotics resistance protein